MGELERSLARSAPIITQRSRLPLAPPPAPGAASTTVTSLFYLNAEQEEAEHVADEAESLRYFRFEADAVEDVPEQVAANRAKGVEKEKKQPKTGRTKRK